MAAAPPPPGAVIVQQQGPVKSYAPHIILAVVATVLCFPFGSIPLVFASKSLKLSSSLSVASFQVKVWVCPFRYPAAVLSSHFIPQSPFSFLPFHCPTSPALPPLTIFPSLPSPLFFLPASISLEVGPLKPS